MSWTTDLRRGVTKRAVLGALRAAGALGPDGSRSLGAALGRGAGLLPPLRDRLVANLRSAGVDDSPSTVRAYFRRFGAWAGHSLGVYGAGLEGSHLRDLLSLDPDTVGRLDAAVARGRGVVLAAPHLFFHELGAGLVHRRHALTAVVRESKDPAWVAVKTRWYGEALGVGTVLRPRRSSGMSEMAAMLRVLRAGGVLGITPDVVTARGSGVPVTVFGRTAYLSPGMILLAMRTGAPLITVEPGWYPDRTSPIGERARVRFTEPMDLPSGGDRTAALQIGLQRWFDGFAAVLRREPAAWLFWLDKAWTTVWEQPAPQATRAA